MMMTRLAKVSTGRLTMGDMVDRVDEETLAARTQLKTWQIPLSVSFIFVRHSTGVATAKAKYE